MDYGDILFDNPNAQEYLNQLQSQSAANNQFNAQQALQQMEFQDRSNAKAMEFSHHEAELQRGWQEMMSNTAYQRQVKDMIAAGLNPVLGISNSGASTPSGASASGVTSGGAKADADTSINNAMASFVGALINGATSRDVANISAAASMHNAQLSADATKYAAGLNASASRYAADVAAANVAAQLQAQYDLNPIGIIEQILSGSGYGAVASALDNIMGQSSQGYVGNIKTVLQSSASTVGSSIKDAIRNYAVKQLNNSSVRNSEYRGYMQKLINWSYK